VAGDFELTIEAGVFEQEVVGYLHALNKNIEEEMVRLAEDLLRRVRMRTPILTGRLYNSWHIIKPGEMDSYEYSDFTGRSFDGALSVGHAESDEMVIESFVGTNVPYAILIEAGHSRKAPSGMLAISIAEITGGLEKAAEDALNRTTF